MFLHCLFVRLAFSVAKVEVQDYGKLEWIKINKATIGAVPKLQSHDYIGNIM